MGLNSFIDTAVKQILSKGLPLDKLAIVVPSQRAIRYLQRSLANQLEKPSFAPRFFHIGSFVESLSSLQRTSTPFLLVKLYKAYQEGQPSETQMRFEEFLSWGPAVLKMFNDLDAHLVDVDLFFKDLQQYYQLQDWGQANFDVTFVAKQNKLYEQLPGLYERFQELLLEEGLAYMGLQYRQAIDALESYIDAHDYYHYFLGFNALNAAEQTLIRELMNQDQAEVLWNIDAYFFEHSQHKAGSYIRNYYRQWPELRQLQKPNFPRDFEQPKEFKTYGVQGNIAQVKAAISLVEKEGLDPSKTVLVLGDEAYLVPLLSTLPTDIDWNVTMGYSIAGQDLALFVLEWFRFIDAHSESDLSLKELYKLLNSAVFFNFFGSAWTHVKNYLEQQLHSNRGRISREEWQEVLNSMPEFQRLFDVYPTPLTALEALDDFMGTLVTKVDQGKGILEKKIAVRLGSIVQNLKELIGAQIEIDRVATLSLFFQILMEPEKVDLLGSTEKGLQIMGVLETRLLDFENVIITHVNEGTLPKSSDPNHPLIPFALQKAYELPTFLEQDSVYTDHFYRLIQRSKRVFLFYNAQTEGLNPGEKSRFLYQLEFQPLTHHSYIEQQWGFSNTNSSWEFPEIPKDPSIVETLNAWATKRISATALGTYLRDPQMFYRRWVLGVDEQEHAFGRMSPKDRGNVLHTTLENLYQPYVQKSLTVKDLDQMIQDFPERLEEQYLSEFQGDTKRLGYAFLDYELLKGQIQDYLQSEKAALEKGVSIELIALELEIDWVWDQNPLGIPLRFKGFIDRLERRNGQLMVVDYKSGRVEASALKIDDWEALLTDAKKDKALQLCLYAWLLYRTQNLSSLVLGNVGFKNPKLQLLPFQFHPKRSDPTPTILEEEQLMAIEEVVVTLIAEILDPKRTFKAR